MIDGGTARQARAAAVRGGRARAGPGLRLARLEMVFLAGAL